MSHTGNVLFHFLDLHSPPWHYLDRKVWAALWDLTGVHLHAHLSNVAILVESDSLFLDPRQRNHLRQQARLNGRPPFPDGTHSQVIAGCILEPSAHKYVQGDAPIACTPNAKKYCYHNRVRDADRYMSFRLLGNSLTGIDILGLGFS